VLPPTLRALHIHSRPTHPQNLRALFTQFWRRRCVFLSFFLTSFSGRRSSAPGLSPLLMLTAVSKGLFLRLNY
jgi:hypothetical protein